MRYILLIMGFLFFGSSQASAQKVPNSIYDFKVEGLTGEVIDFSKFKGKNILIVNTASKCGHTPQYKDLEQLYQRYKGDLVIVGFPANNFLGQEPGTNEQIAQFCKENYGVTFPMAAKISVKGKNMAPIYRWLTNKDFNGQESSSVKWNFQKYLIDRSGKLIGVFSPSTNPLSEEITSKVK